jgi:hypothetical protein
LGGRAVSKANGRNPIAHRQQPAQNADQAEPGGSQPGRSRHFLLGTGRDISAGSGYAQGCLIVTGLDRRRVPSLMALAYQRRGDKEVRGGPVAGDRDVADNRDPEQGLSLRIAPNTRISSRGGANRAGGPSATAALAGFKAGDGIDELSEQDRQAHVIGPQVPAPERHADGLTHDTEIVARSCRSPFERICRASCQKCRLVPIGGPCGLALRCAEACA